MKFSGAMDIGTSGAANELLASLLAEHFGILRPRPAFVELHADLIKWLAVKRPELRGLIGRSGDLNFATELITGAAEWPTGRMVPDAMVPGAIQVFAFDALISNDDRRYNNPNVLIRGDDIFAIDHEAAFSFVYLVSSAHQSWAVRDRRSLTDHVFFLQLRQRAIDLSPFTARLAELGSAKLEEIVGRLPGQWRHDRLGQISAHLQSARDNAFEFERQLLERLA
ncbi:MAG TPA: HipA family kinase [Bryobacteraceae bacterium]|nr:HipA family kinase [Bryobacteraceae bacterium]